MGAWADLTPWKSHEKIFSLRKARTKDRFTFFLILTVDNKGEGVSYTKILLLDLGRGWRFRWNLADPCFGVGSADPRIRDIFELEGSDPRIRGSATRSADPRIRHRIRGSASFQWNVWLALTESDGSLTQLKRLVNIEERINLNNYNIIRNITIVN